MRGKLGILIYWTTGILSLGILPAATIDPFYGGSYSLTNLGLSQEFPPAMED
jgi:hypothetical protein